MVVACRIGKTYCQTEPVPRGGRSVCLIDAEHCISSSFLKVNISAMIYIVTNWIEYTIVCWSNILHWSIDVKFFSNTSHEKPKLNSRNWMGLSSCHIQLITRISHVRLPYLSIHGNISQRYRIHGYRKWLR